MVFEKLMPLEKMEYLVKIRIVSAIKRATSIGGTETLIEHRASIIALLDCLDCVLVSKMQTI